MGHEKENFSSLHQKIKGKEEREERKKKCVMIT